ncbi:class I SAM-dependent methyltransferase [Halococcus qingdaonensis]|uniref:class I SAM-dependent methyltransferase n=1 Tax=Halococcus qingdaonensis TaxID=224402 RepID=UPI0021169BDB|nr:class I SAM-dependent methyltransferase [Halococcus qingdaonensis]
MTGDKRAIRDGYDAIVDEYLARRTNEHADRPHLDWLCDRLADGARVLDAGCGAGVPVAERLADDHDVVGVDLSREQLRRARKDVAQARFVQGDMSALGFVDDGFDAICALFSLIHVPLDEHARVAAAFHRVLRPGGLAVLTVGGDEGWDGTNPDWLETGVEMRWSFPDTETSARQFADAGFEIHETRSIENSTFEVLFAENRKN